MSGRIVGEVLNHAPEDLTHLELLVLVSLAESARERDRTALYNTSAERLADRTRSTAGSVRNALATLRRRGLIHPLNTSVKRGHAQQYHIATMTESTRRAVWQ